MSKPTTIGTLTRVADDPQAPVGLRVQALNALEHPQIAMLLRLMRHPKTPPKLRALASIRYVAEMERKAARKKATTKAPDMPVGNDLGLKI